MAYKMLSESKLSQAGQKNKVLEKIFLLKHILRIWL